MSRRLPAVAAMFSRLTLRRAATLLLWIAWGWVVMTLTHELGHVVGGLIGGAKIAAIELRPWHLPYSVLAPDPHPLWTLWAGPALGCMIPIAVAGSCRRPDAWFIGWFCLVANASYLLLGYLSGDAQLDTTRMLKAGTPPAAIFVTAVPLLVVGYMGLRRSCLELLSEETATPIDSRNRASALSLLVVLIVQSAVGSLLAR